MDRRTVKKGITMLETNSVPKLARQVAAMALLIAIPASGRAQDGGGGAKVEAPRFVPQALLDRIAEFAQSAPPPLVGHGDRVVTGRVVTDAGQPLAGVRIRATSVEYPVDHVTHHAFDDAPPDEVSLARALGSSAKYWYARATRTLEAKTAADGTYTLDHLVAEQLVVEGWRAGFYVEPVGQSSGRQINVSESTTVDFVASPCVRQKFDLRLPDGSTPERAKLQFERFGDRNRTEWETWTRAEPAIPLPAGDWTVTAVVESDEPQVLSTDSGWFHSRPTHVHAAPATAGESVSLELLGNAAIEGTVVEPSNPSRRNVSVVAIALAPDEAPDPKLFGDAANWRRRGDVRRDWLQRSSGGKSTFRIARIEPGRWLVGLLEYRDETPLVSAVVAVGHEVVRADFTLPPARSDAELSLRVSDPDGGVLRDCELESTYAVHGPDGTTLRDGGDAGARRTLEGAFALARGSLHKEAILFVAHPRFGVQWIEVPAEARALELRFAAAAVPTLRLAGYADHAQGRCVDVEVTRVTDPKFEHRPVKLDASAIAADGAVTLGRFQPGTYRIRVFAGADWRENHDGHEVAAATVELAAGACDVELPFPPLALLEVVVAAGTKDTFILTPLDAAVANDSRVTRQAAPDAAGVLTFPDVPPGLYEVSSWGDRHMVVEAPAAKPIAFVAEAVNALRVVVTDPKGALAKLGLKSGDAVVAVDGQEFGNRQQLDWIRQALKGEVVTLTVNRGGELFEVVVPRSFLKDARAAGGRLREGAR